MGSPPSVVSVCPSPALAGQVVWSQSFGPSCCSCVLALMGSLVRHSVALASCRTPSFCCFSPGFLPLVFVQAWVGRLRSCLGSFLLLGGSPSLVLVVFAWRFQLFGCPSSLSFLELFAGVLSSCFQCLLIAQGGCRIVLGYPPSVAWRREELPWFSVRGMSACPSGAAGFMVFAMGSPVSCRDCVLPQSAIVTKTFPPSGGFGSWPSCGVPYLRLALCSSACVSPVGCPSF